MSDAGGEGGGQAGEEMLKFGHSSGHHQFLQTILGNGPHRQNEGGLLGGIVWMNRVLTVCQLYIGP